MRQINERGLSLVKSFEGCELVGYPDPGTGGKPYTIGYGHTGPEVRLGQRISQDEADELLRKDLERFERGVVSTIGDTPTSDDQFSAFVCLAFNIGLSAFAGSTVLKRHKLGNHMGSANAFLMWKRAGNQILRGLIRRREAERRLYLGEPA